MGTCNTFEGLFLWCSNQFPPPFNNHAHFSLGELAFYIAGCYTLNYVPLKVVNVILIGNRVFADGIDLE